MESTTQFHLSLICSLLNLLMQLQQQLISLLADSIIPPPPIAQMLPNKPSHALIRSLLYETIEWNENEVKKPRINSGDMILDNEELLFFLTYCTKADFSALYERLEEELNKSIKGMKSRKKILSNKHKLLLILIWNRHYKTNTELGFMFGLSDSAVDKYINKLVPRIANIMKVELQLPSSQRLEALKETIPEYPNAIGSIDGTIHPLRLPSVGEHRYFRGDKSIHFYNTLTLCDVTGALITAEPGFAGRMLDSDMFHHSNTSNYLRENNVQALADRGFRGDTSLILPVGENTSQQMANRTRIENTHREFHARGQITKQVWRHRRRLHSPAMLLSLSLFNFIKRRRLNRTITIWRARRN